MTYISFMDLGELISAALTEDLQSAGDVTSNAIFSEERGKAKLISKDSGILAGTEVFAEVFKAVDTETELVFHKTDGSSLVPGDDVASLDGSIKSILTAERTGINFLSYLSGIATRTRTFVDILGEACPVTILDTRKTLPGYRKLAKVAVTAGGGENHRMGLYDMVMIKDNHIDAAGSISDAVRRIRETYGEKYKIEVECRTIQDVREAVSLAVDIVMLDNMEPSTVKEALHLKSGNIRFEVSGNINLDTIASYALDGIDYISIGSLTHSVEAFDFSLQIE